MNQNTQLFKQASHTDYGFYNYHSPTNLGGLTALNSSNLLGASSNLLTAGGVSSANMYGSGDIDGKSKRRRRKTQSKHHRETIREKDMQIQELNSLVLRIQEENNAL